MSGMAVVKCRAIMGGRRGKCGAIGECHQGGRPGQEPSWPGTVIARFIAHCTSHSEVSPVMGKPNHCHHSHLFLFYSYTVAPYLPSSYDMGSLCNSAAYWYKLFCLCHFTFCHPTHLHTIFRHSTLFNCSIKCRLWSGSITLINPSRFWLIAQVPSPRSLMALIMLLRLISLFSFCLSCFMKNMLYVCFV